MSESIVFTQDDINRTLERLAHQIIEKNRQSNDLLLIGLVTRGAPLAQRLASAITRITGHKVWVGALDFTLYRDDLGSSANELIIQPSDIPQKVTGKNVVLIDDVLCTGRSVRAAIDALVDWGRPKSVQVAVLIDRGHREMPIKADFVGKNIPSALHERIQVRLNEVDGKDEVVIIRSEKMLTVKGKAR